MFYSKTTGGFYDPVIHGDNIPADAIEIPREAWKALIDGQSCGKRIVADTNGYPVLVDPAPVLQADLISSRLVQLREVREKILNRLGDIAGRADRSGDTVLAGACDAAALALLDITANLPATMDEVEAEVTNRYGAIANAAITAAPSLATAFASIDL